MSKQMVIILGHSPASNIGLARSLWKDDREVIVICNLKYSYKIHPESKSRYVKKILFLDPEDVEGTINFLITNYANMPLQPVLLATSDVAADFLDAFYDRLKGYFKLPKLDHTICTSKQLMDKSFQKEKAREAGFNVLNAWVLDLRKDNYIIPDEIQYPCFTKGVMSIMTPKRFLKRCDNFVQLEEHLANIKKEKPSIIMVEQLANIKREWGVMAFCNGSDVYIPAITEFTVLGKGSIPGVSMQGIVHPIDEKSEIYRVSLSFLRSLNMVGLCNIDLFEIDGKFYFSELNIRYAAYCYAIAKGGVNLPEMCVDTLFGEHIVASVIKSDVVYFSEYIACADILARKISCGTAISLMKDADVCMIFDKEDKMPVIYYIMDFFKRCLHIIIRKTFFTIKGKIMCD